MDILLNTVDMLKGHSAQPVVLEESILLEMKARKIAGIRLINYINDGITWKSHKDIILDSERRTVMLKHKGQQLDLGAVAKGYAADEVRNLMLTYGIKNAMINFGGTVINLGQTRRIGVQKPFSPNGKSFASINIPDGKAVVSSGLYEQL